MKRAFLSVSNKNNIEPFARQLIDHDVHLIASDGTAEYLLQRGVMVSRISELLNLTPLMDGRVKTLHPTLYAGILADPTNALHEIDLQALTFNFIDFVIVDLYPFAQTPDIDTIDIGGVSLIRAAAKNYQFCTVLCQAADYSIFLEEMRLHEGATSLDFRKKMAARAFNKTSALDTKIASWLNDEVQLDYKLNKIADLAYGENPHQTAGLYQFDSATLGYYQHQGKEISYNNLLDLDAGMRVISEFKEPAATIIKHTNPCGVALGISSLDAVQNAFAADNKSAFGGIVVLNSPIDKESAQFLSQHFLEIVAAPEITLDALDILRKKSKLRVLEFQNDRTPNDTEIRSIFNGLLIQQSLSSALRDEFTFPTERKPTNNEMSDLEFAFKVATHVKSNAIVLAQNGITLGIGAGQMSRIDAVELSLKKAQNKHFSNAVLASDGFFPFADSIECIAAAGIKAIIQPGGSVRDQEIIEACNANAIAMIFTGRRVFKH